MKEFYNSNPDFKDYVDKYCKKHKCTVDEALKHALVQEVRKAYFENAKQLN